MERFVELGCYIAYGGAATFKRNDDVREAFAATPLDRILFETDCPYMAPEPIRGLECEPAMISITANALVNDRVDRTGEDAETIAQAAWENACKLFQKKFLRSWWRSVILIPARGRGGIGRRVRFRSVWGQPHEGSSPFARTID